MKYGIVEVWDGAPYKKVFVTNAINKHYDRLIFCCLNEWEWPICCSQLFNLPIQKINQLCKENGLTLEVVSSGRLRRSVPEYSNIIYTEPTNVWFAIAGIHQLLGVNLDERHARKPIKYPFVSLNHRGHYHRCLMIDLLAKENLIDKGAITWHNTQDLLCIEYTWEHFSPREMTLTDNFEPNWNTPPKEYFESFCQLVSESTLESTIMSEKTYGPIFFKKPFIVHSAPNFYTQMDELGFLRYDEIFDYSFDVIDNDKLRLEMIIENIKIISEKSLDELESLLVQLEPKLEHNFKVACNLATDSSNYPKLLKDVIDYYNQGNDISYQLSEPYKSVIRYVEQQDPKPYNI